MPLPAWKKELTSFLEETEKADVNVVVMPDFFLDRLITLDWDANDLSKIIINVSKRKGGSIDGIPQIDIQGGNAVNTASALTMLGAKVTPIVCTNEHGLHQITYFLKSMPINISRVKIYEKASITTALELKNGNEKTNVMIRDLGSLADFGPENLDEDDYSLIEHADYVCLFNWAGTLKFGTKLAQAVFGTVKTNGKGKTYYDTADPTPNSGGIADLMETVLKSNQVDILSVNENEAIAYASLLDNSLKMRGEKLQFAELAMEAARILAKHLTARIDLHTTAFSATLQGKREVVVSTFKVKVLRATGAGDAWNAGNIIGDRNNLSDECRLAMANAVSACYLSDTQGKHPSLSRLSQFLSSYA